MEHITEENGFNNSTSGSGNKFSILCSYHRTADNTQSLNLTHGLTF